jgi:hypothetical protein
VERQTVDWADLPKAASRPPEPIGQADHPSPAPPFTSVWHHFPIWWELFYLEIMFEYLHQNRYQKGTGPNGILGGDVDGFGIRTQFFF